MFKKASKAAFSISRLNSAHIPSSSLRFSHFTKNQEPETDQEKLNQIFDNLVREDIDHFGEDGFYCNPNFTDEIKERFGIEIEKPANSPKKPVKEKLQISQNESQFRIK